jgi:hypothetical protein
MLIYLIALSLLGGAIKCMDKRHYSRESVNPPIKTKEHDRLVTKQSLAELKCT